jgi:hypothetical protein
LFLTKSGGWKKPKGIRILFFIVVVSKRNELVKVDVCHAI